MKNLIIVSIYLSAFLLVTACSPESATMKSERILVQPEVVVPNYAPAQLQKFDWITIDGGQSQLDFNPQVDILFVTDNSESMTSAQENLTKNIGEFTKGILNNKMIDYQIGVISVWDSSEDYKKNKKDSYEMGDLRFIKNAQAQEATNRRFIAKSDNNPSLIAPTLKIGVVALKEGGPENEEVLAPLSAALSPNKLGRGGVNEGFIRPNAQLVVILLTDADDSSKNITGEQMAQELVALKGKKVAVYGALVRKNDPDSAKDFALKIHPKYHPECFDMTAKTPKLNGTCTEGFGPDVLEKFIYQANAHHSTVEEIRDNHFMSIVSKDFGKDLGKIGSDITAKTLAKEILLTQIPRKVDGKYQIRVFYGKQEIPNKAKGGWLYDDENKIIKLSGEIEYKYVEGARFSVQIVPVALKQ